MKISAKEVKNEKTHVVEDARAVVGLKERQKVPACSRVSGTLPHQPLSAQFQRQARRANTGVTHPLCLDTSLPHIMVSRIS